MEFGVRPKLVEESAGDPQDPRRLDVGWPERCYDLAHHGRPVGSAAKAVGMFVVRLSRGQGPELGDHGDA